MVLPETEILTKDHVRQLVTLLIRQGRVHFWDIVTRLNVKPMVVQDFLEREKQNGLINLLGGGMVALTADGEAFARVNQLSYPDFSCSHCDGKKVSVELYPSDLDEFRTLFVAKPVSSPAFDQVSSSPETAIRRTLFMVENGDVAGKAVAFMGDNDLISIALAQLGLAKRLTVFELDARIIDYINEISYKKRLQIEVVEQDLRNSLPSIYMNQFDTFFTDQPYTLAGITLFLSRGIEVLKEQSGLHGYFCLSDVYLLPQDLFAIQKMLTEMQFLIREIQPDFNEYEIPEYHRAYYANVDIDASHMVSGKRHWFKSSLVKGETIEGTRSLVSGGFWEEYIYDYRDANF